MTNKLSTFASLDDLSSTADGAGPSSGSAGESSTSEQAGRPRHHPRRRSSSSVTGHRRSSSVQINYDVKAAQDARRYDDFTTVDWVQDTLRERARRQAERASSTRTLGSSLNAVLWRAVEAGNDWFVVSLVGLIIGLNAAFSSIVTVWLSDLKLGRCNAGWWLNRKFCCWQLSEAGECQDWHSWTSFVAIQFVFYVALAGLFAYVCAFIVKSWAPYAAGSGISEIKCILAGFIIHGFLSFSTFFVKTITLPIAIASGLSVGKEGPSVHVACSIGHTVANQFSRFRRSQAKMREIVTAASAAGVAVAFGSPIGGVLFSLEEMTINFPIKTMWRSFFCALVATVTLSAMNPFRTGKLVLFQVHFDRDWHFFELGFFALIGVFGGLYGAFVIKYNLQVQAFRRKHLASSAIGEATFLAILTACVGFTNMFLRIDMNESLEILFRECEGGGDYENLCQTWAQWRMVNSLLLATVLRTCLVVISYGCKVPAGIFVPSMAVGATFGRMVGILVKALYRAHPNWPMFSACDPAKPCITPGTYAFLGAAAGLAGITRITVTVVVIMFELTGALTYILPTMIVVLVTKAVSDQFGQGGIADQMIRFNGFPFLESEDHAFNVPVSKVMKSRVVYLPSTGIRLHELETMLAQNAYQGFPIVKSRTDPTLLGEISRTDLKIAIQKAKEDDLIAPDAFCSFCLEAGHHSPDLETASASPSSSSSEDDDEVLPPETVDFTPYVNETPISVSPKQPLEIVMELFKKMGPRVVLVEDRGGKLVGLATVKDCLRYTLAHERAHAAVGHGVDGAGAGEGMMMGMGMGRRTSMSEGARAAGSGAEELEVALEELAAWFAEAREGVWSYVTGRRSERGTRSDAQGGSVRLEDR